MTSNNGNLWLAETLWHLGAFEFGDFTVGRTAVGSPIYINPRKIIGHPGNLARAALVIQEEIETLQAMRHPEIQQFDLIAGVPLGGLHIATAYSLAADVPMVYLHPGRDEDSIEGVYTPGQTAIIMDDLVTGGGSIAETAEALREAGLIVRDAFVLVDRQQGARERLKRMGINLRAALTLEVILNALKFNGYIEDSWYRRSVQYLERNRGENGN
jgi:orotate phosphoribosyltransferase/uridine monophosphate synthetase